jgi:hypothetical protein
MQSQHIAVPLTEFFYGVQLANKIIREKLHWQSEDTKRSRDVSKFLEGFKEWAPRAVLKYISSLLPHLDPEVRLILSYSLQVYGPTHGTAQGSMAILENISCLICTFDGPKKTHQ